MAKENKPYKRRCRVVNGRVHCDDTTISTPPTSTGYVDAPDFLASSKRMTINFEHVLTGNQVFFPAFLTQFSDAWSSDWEDTPVYGRMDDIRTFRRTRRVISLAWSVVAASEDEAAHNLEACSRLISMLYPTYAGESASTISGGPLFKLKFANLISDPTKSGWGASVTEAGLVGTISGITYEPELEGQNFFIVEDGLLAKQVNLSCEFAVLHTKPVGWREQSFRQEMYPYGVGGHGINEEDISAAQTAKKAASGDGNPNTISSPETRDEQEQARENNKSDIQRGVSGAAGSEVLG